MAWLPMHSPIQSPLPEAARLYSEVSSHQISAAWRSLLEWVVHTAWNIEVVALEWTMKMLSQFHCWCKWALKSAELPLLAPAENLAYTS